MSVSRSRILMAVAAASLALSCSSSEAVMQGFLKMTNGYFYDNVTGKAFLPHGVAYQTWNRPLGVWQTPDQLRYDLDEMVKMGANSIRIDIVWQHAEEKGDNQWSWDNYDLIVNECEKRDIRIFALIGYQWPPNWFPDAWYTMHPPEWDSEGIYHSNRWQSDIIGYETPEARAQYTEWISNACARFKNSKAIAGWIVGNESGYLGLWSGLLDGYDPNCEAAFRTWVGNKYGTIASANAAWGTTYTNLNQVKFVEQYRAYGVDGAEWADMVQWREDSIASFTAIGAKAAKNSDTNHLISYSTVGMQWGEEDWRYHAEDRGKITAACLATNAAIDFFSVNNYPWSILGHESQNGQWGVSFTKKVAKVPVLYSETGFTSSETMWGGMNILRQGPLIRNALWESLECGAIGTHIFSWMDRPYITDREKGFGIVYGDRNIKPAYWTSRDAYNLMEQTKLADILMGSKDPKPDIAFLWTDAADSQYNRYECEMQQIAGALERLGYEPNFMNLADLGARSYTNFRVVILPRNMRVEDVVPNSTNKTTLDFLRQDVIGAGVHVMASADIPGLQNFNGKERSQYIAENAGLFGIDATDIGGFEVPMRRRHYVTWYWNAIDVTFNTNAIGAIAGNYDYKPYVWKYSEEVKVTSGGVAWATMDVGRNKGFEANNSLLTNWDGSWSNVFVRNNWGWQLDGANMVQMWGDSGMWKDLPVVPFGHYTFSAYLRNNSDDPLTNGSCASVSIEWNDEAGYVLGVDEVKLTGTTPSNSWVKYTINTIAPSNAWTGRRMIRIRPDNLLVNGALTGTGAAPDNWNNWNDTQHDPDFVNKMGTNGNSWTFWYDGGIYQDVTTGFSVGDKLSFGGYLYTPDNDALRNGTKSGSIEIEFYNGGTWLSTVSAGSISASSTNDHWISIKADAVVPASATIARLVVRCNNFSNGDGRFNVDEVFVRNGSRGNGSVYVDQYQRSPAVVVKNHGPAKSAIFLYSFGDNAPDRSDDTDNEPDTAPWKWRYDVMQSIIRDYFGVTPAISCSGTNAFLCLPEYRTTTNGGVLIQMKNYLYDTNLPNGGVNQSFTLNCSLLTGKIVRAFQQGNIVEENSDGQVTVSLPPDGQEILYAYNAAVPAATTPEGGSFRASNNRDGFFPSGGPTNYPLNYLFRCDYLFSGQTEIRPSPVVAYDRLYFLSQWWIQCWDIKTNTMLWAYSVRPTNGTSGIYLNPNSLVVAEGKVFASGKYTSSMTNAALWAVDAFTGELRWQQTNVYRAADSYVGCSPLVVTNGVVYYGERGGPFKAADANSGVTLWTGPSCSYISEAAPALAGGYLYTPDLKKISAADGSLVWQGSFGASSFIDTTPAVVSNKVYVTVDSTNTSLKCYDANTGSNLWTGTGTRAPFSPGTGYQAPAVGNGKVYWLSRPATNGVSFDVNLTCINASTGGPVLWQYPLWGSYYRGTPVATSNRVYSTSYYTLYVNDPATGSLLWSTNLSYSGRDLGDVFIKNGWLFVGDTIAMYAMNDGSAWSNAPVSANTNEIVTISDAPAVVHPFGDKVYTLKVKYDCRDVVGLKLYAAFQENGDNGDGVSNEIYQILTNSVSGNGEQWYYMWIPDANPLDTDYKSTPDGGKYVFNAWLANTAGVKVAQAVPQSTILEWGVRPTNGVPTNVTMGSTVTFNAEWEDLYEQIWWQNTPMSRNDSYPSRIAVFRSTKTEAQYPGHLAKVNQVCDWLQTLGYVSANPLDIQFDNVTVSNLFSDNFNDGDYAGWTRDAGALNWTVESRDKLEVGDNLPYTNYFSYGVSSTNLAVDYCITADSGRYVDQFEILLTGGGVSPTFSLCVLGDSNGVPSGVPLAVTNFVAPTNVYSWLAINLPEFALTSGQKYHFVMKWKSGAIDSSNYMRVQYMGPYTTSSVGSVLGSSDGGGSWTSQNGVPAFRIVYADAGWFAQPYSSLSQVGVIGNTRYGQKITLPNAMTVTNIAAYIYKPTTPAGGLQLNLRRWSDKALVATSTVAAASIPTGFTWVNFKIPSAVLGSGTSYFYEIQNLDATGTYYALRANCWGGVYGNSSWGSTNDFDVYTTTAGTNWVSEPNYDLEFNIQGSGGKDLALRASRIGNDENYICAGNTAWTNVSVAADIKYCKQDPYFNDAEVLLHYMNRSNYYKVGIRNFYGFWRLKYTVRVNNHVEQTGWLMEFPKTNRPADKVWYNLRVDSVASTNKVYFNGVYAGAFYATNLPNGKIGLGTKASQLGIWEPQKGYYFIDDDENGYSADPYTNGAALNLDYGYLNQFYNTLVLPSVYVMNDKEASNVVIWITNGLNSIIAFDGGVAMKDETGAADLGRVENLFGVSPSITASSNITKVIIGTNSHYVTLDYTSGAQIAASGSGIPYTALTRGIALGTVTNSSPQLGLIANVVTNNINAMAKTFLFNFGADTGGQLTNSLKMIAQRAFEWARGQANKVRIELKYTNPYTNNPNADLTIYSTNVWVLGGTGTTNINVQLPAEGLMTGDKMYWVMYTYPWDATNAWISHDGFFTSGDDNLYTVIPGPGLQILGITDKAFGGRVWDMWVGYNTRNCCYPLYLVYGLKERGPTRVEDNFQDMDYNGWTVSGDTNIGWGVTNGIITVALQAAVNTYSSAVARITYNGFTVNGATNLTFEWDQYAWATDGGFLFRGVPLEVNPNRCGWGDSSPQYFTNNKPRQSSYQRIVVNIRDGVPYPRSDLFVDSKPVFVDEPIEVTNWTTNVVGFLAPSSNQYPFAIGQWVQWDDFRIVDEHYWTAYTWVYGEGIPTDPNTPSYWPNVPDYDPDILEYVDSGVGGKYQWYIYARGSNVYAYSDVNIYFSPRLRVEQTNFPKNLNPGTTTNLPVDWASLIPTQMPVRLICQLYDQYEGRMFVETTNLITNTTGSINVPVTIPTNAWGGTNYVWSAFMFPTNASNPWVQRIGADDTYRWDDLGYGLSAETKITMSGAPKTDGVYNVYADFGIPVGSSILTWQYPYFTVAYFDAVYNGITPPEGSTCFRTYVTYQYGGWGIFRAGMNMSKYTNGYLKFWLNSPATVKIDLEGPQGTKRTQYMPSTTSNWLQVSLPITNFAGVNLSSMYGLFEATAETPETFYVDDVKWSPTP